MNQEQMNIKEPNMKAAQLRHSRVFLKSGFLAQFSKALPTFKALFKKIKFSLFRRKRRNISAGGVIDVRDPFSKFLKQTFAVGAALLIITSFAPSQILETGFTADYFDVDTDYIDPSDELTEQVFIMNDEGYVLKPSPVSEDANRIGLTDSVQHTVVYGDTLSSIAALYGVSVRTLLWENSLFETSTLRIGQVLNIPSIDGVSHIVAGNNETLSSIAKLYNVEVQLIKDHNNLDSDTIAKGQRLFIPGGKKIEPVRPLVNRAGSRSSSGGRSYNTFDNKVVMATDDTPVEGKKLIYPTVGNLTQGYRGGHLAYDIGNASKPDVWAAKEGVIVKVHGGCPVREVSFVRNCGGGYGNYAVVDHGDGLQTLYAHLETIYVSEGESVSRGQAIGKMGASGRVYGKTGIHLHFEVFDNGVKRNPGKYF